MRKAAIIFAVCMLSLLSCNKDDIPGADTSITSSGLSSGKAGIAFTTDADFGGSRSFRVRNTALTTASSAPVGSTRRYIVLRAEEPYGASDTRRATIYITVPVTFSLPLNIDLSAPMSSIPSAQVELYYSYLGGAFGNTYRSASGQLTITKLTDAEIEGSFSAPVTASPGPGFMVSAGLLAGKF